MAALPIVLILALQGIDIALHIATDQFEIIRVASNIVVALGAMAMFFTPNFARLALLGSGATYLLLNAIFVAQNGVSNPDTNALRVPLIGFVIVTLALLIWSRLRARAANKEVE